MSCLKKHDPIELGCYTETGICDFLATKTCALFCNWWISRKTKIVKVLSGLVGGYYVKKSKGM